jgi:hypothetical protein
LLSAHVSVLGVAWLRIAAVALVFALWRRPWRQLRVLTVSQRWVLLELGAVLAAMNSLFSLAIDRLPLATVGAIGLVTAGVALHHNPARPDPPPASAVFGRRRQLRSGCDSRQDSPNASPQATAAKTRLS